MKKQQKLLAAHANDFAIAGIQNSSKARASPNNNNQVCNWCGAARHAGKFCPAVKATSFNCGKIGHFKKVCRSKSVKLVTVYGEEHDDSAEKLTLLIETAPISNVKLQHIRETVQNDNVCKTVLNYCKSGWPKVSKLSKDLLPFYNLRNDLSVQNGLLLKREAIIIPEKTFSKKVHEGHQGVNKCRDRAKDILWWPGISRDIGNWVKYCAVCSSVCRILKRGGGAILKE